MSKHEVNVTKDPSLCLNLTEKIPGDLLAGCGDGEVVSVEETPIKKAVAGQVVFPTQVGDPTKPNLTQKKSTKFDGSITSMILTPSGTEVLISTSSCKVFRMTILTFSHYQILSCPSRPILTASFPSTSCQLYAVGGEDGVQLWTEDGQLVLHIPPALPGLAATQVRLSSDGRSIISGWSDANVRIYTPETGKLVEEIRNAVTGGQGVTAMAVSGRGDKMVVGGGDGAVRVWDIGWGTAKLVKTVR